MDTIVTLEGRRQIAGGKLRAEYVSFTDATAFYSLDAVSGSADATVRLYFEQSHLPQDQITFEADDSGNLKPFKNAEGINLSSGKIANYVSASIYTGSIKEFTTFLTGASFASTAGTLLASSINNFKNLYIIGTRDYVFEDEGFGTGVSNIEYSISDNLPIDDDSLHERLVEDLPSLFSDKLLSNVDNFKFLPPINRIDDKLINKSDPLVIQQNAIGNYSRFGEYDEYTPVQLENDLLEVEKLGFKKTLYFDPTSLNNKLVSQFFEISDSEMKKLDVIDYGQYYHNGVIKQAFFVGKVFVDSNGTDTFVRMFTIVFE
jgi:hypothetical protein